MGKGLLYNFDLETYQKVWLIKKHSEHLYISWNCYVSVVWSSYTKKKISSLEQIQRRVRIFILGKEYSEHERLSQLNLLP